MQVVWKVASFVKVLSCVNVVGNVVSYVKSVELCEKLCVSYDPYPVCYKDDYKWVCHVVQSCNVGHHPTMKLLSLHTLIFNHIQVAP